MGFLQSAGVWIEAESVRSTGAPLLCTPRMVSDSRGVLPSEIEGQPPKYWQSFFSRQLPGPRPGHAWQSDWDVSLYGAERSMAWVGAVVAPPRGLPPGKIAHSEDPVLPIPLEEMDAALYAGSGASAPTACYRPPSPVSTRPVPGQEGQPPIRLEWLGTQTGGPQKKILPPGRAYDTPSPIETDAAFISPWWSFSVSPPPPPRGGSSACSTDPMAGEPDLPAWLAVMASATCSPVHRVPWHALSRGGDEVPLSLLAYNESLEAASGTWIAALAPAAVVGRRAALPRGRAEWASDDAMLIAPQPAVWSGQSVSFVRGYATVWRGEAQAGVQWITSIIAAPGPYWCAAGQIWFAGAVEGCIIAD